MPANRPFNRQAMNLIANFQGLPGHPSRAYFRKEKGLDEVMDRIIERFQIQDTRPEEVIAAHWIAIVGNRYSQYSYPVRLDRGKRLFVAVSNSIVKQEMWFHRKQILQRLKLIHHGVEIRDIVLRAG